MKKARLTTGIVLLILLASLIPWPQAMAITPQDQTIGITDTHDDLFITETGIGIDSQLCHITDPTMDVRSFLVFRELEINFWEPLKNATLRFRTTATLDFDADSSVTVYGMRYSDLQREGWLNPGWVLSVPITSASVDVNTSQFSGQTWHEVDVTAIVEELIRSYDWDGDGADGTETGDAIGFIIYGAEGHDTRWFIDYLYGTPSLASHLVLHWNWEPPPPVDPPEDGDPEFVETYGDNYTIWRLPGGVGYSLEPMEYVFTNGTDAPYNILFDNLEGDGPFQVAEVGSKDYYGVTTYGGRLLIRTNNGTLWTTYVRRTDTTNQLFVKKSLDNGTTWVDETQIGSDWTHVNIAGSPSIAVDGLDNIHLIWFPFDGSFLNVSYSMFNGTWSAPITISGGLGREGFDQFYGVIAIDSSDDVHVMWYGKATGFGTYEIWHREYTTSWGPTTRCSTYPGMTGQHQKWPSFTIDSNDVVQAVWQGEATGYAGEQIWYSNYTDEWSYPLRLSTRLHTYHEREHASIAVDSNDFLHVVWDGIDYAVGAPDNIFYKNYTDSWSGSIILPEVVGLNGDQNYPSIAVDSNDSIHVTWRGTLGVASSVVYTNYTDEWLDPAIDLQSGITEYKNEDPKFRWARWPIPGLALYFITDTNGTIILDNGDPLTFNSTDDAEDWIDTEFPDPEDPDPPGWVITGYFTRFKMRLYFLGIGFGCLFGPVLFFAWRRPSGYYLGAGFILMLIGLGLLLAIGQV